LEKKKLVRSFSGEPVAERGGDNRSTAEAVYVESWAKAQLQTLTNAMNAIVADGGEPYVALDQPWTQPLAPVPINNIAVSGYIVDLGGLLDVNSLIASLPEEEDREAQFDEAFLERFEDEAFLENLEGDEAFLEDFIQSIEDEYYAGEEDQPELSTEEQNRLKELYSLESTWRRLLQQLPLRSVIMPEQATDLMNWLKHWIGDQQTAADSYYDSKVPAYRPAHLPMASISELRLVEGFDRELYLQLLPFITAIIPDNEDKARLINVNTAPPEVLAAVLNLDSFDTQNIINRRPITTREDLLTALGEMISSSAEMNMAAKLLVLDSYYFLAIAEISSPSYDLTVYSLLEREQQGSVKVIWQSRGAL